MDASTATPAGPEPLKYPLYHYYKTTRKGRIIENWVLAKDSEGKTLWMVDFVDPKTGARERNRIRKFDKMPALVGIASGGARMEVGTKKNGGDEKEEDGGGEGEGKMKKKKCVVM